MYDFTSHKNQSRSLLICLSRLFVMISTAIEWCWKRKMGKEALFTKHWLTNLARQIVLPRHEDQLIWRLMSKKISFKLKSDRGHTAGITANQVWAEHYGLKVVETGHKNSGDRRCYRLAALGSGAGDWATGRLVIEQFCQPTEFPSPA